ncbi:hypothetical protein PFISCL1PPCAC_16998, partial [Pristionchus fissidentatus]
RGKLIYVNTTSTEGTATHLLHNRIVLKFANADSYSNDHSPLVYFCRTPDEPLLVLDTTTMDTLSIKLPRMNSSVVSCNYNMVGVYGGEITMRRERVTKVGDDKYEFAYEFCKAKFPEALKYFERWAMIRDRTADIEKKWTENEEKRFMEKTIAPAPFRPTMYQSIEKPNADIVPINPKQDFRSKFADDFILIREIGSGAFGRVFEAQNILDKWKYAVKRIALPGKSSEDKVQEKLREVHSMAKFDHPNIVRYYGSWIERPPQVPFQEHNVYLYIQMQHCNHSLEDWLRENEQQPRNQERMRDLFKQLVEAVAYIHSKGVIHRDLKPRNILFDDVNRIRVCDLGISTEIAISTIEGEEVSETRTIIGTPLYK